MILAVGGSTWTLGAALAQDPRPVRVVGAGEIISYDPLHGYNLRLQLRVRNLANQPVTITRAEVLMVSQGGWSISQGESISRDGKFLGGDAVLNPGRDDSYDWRGVEASPYTHWLLAFQANLPGRPTFDEVFEIPYRRPGYSSPAPVRINGLVFIGLQEPLEAVELTGGEVWIGIVGQIINLSGKPMSLRKWQFQVKDPAGKVALDRDAASMLQIEGSQQTLNEFYHGFTLPNDFRKGTLHINGEVDLDGKRVVLSHGVPVERTEGYLVKAPLEGVWGWGGGPGSPWFSGHLHDIASRCSYDIGMFREIDGQKVTFSGDREKNEDYFGWDKPIYCVEDGKVVVNVDTGFDNDGPRFNPANAPLPQNCIWVEHAGSRLSCYYHIRRGSSTVKVGQHVKAGQVLARTGNSGNSPETHLHFGYMALDRHSGHYRNVPVRIEGLKFEDGRPAPGVPRNDFYLSTPAQSPN